MPNCDFYALRADSAAVLAIAFEAGCEVHEMFSQPGSLLRQFRDVEDVLSAFDVGTGRSSVHLQLYSSSMRGGVRTRRVDFDPRKVKGPLWRLETCGWGLIQLYLGGLHEGSLSVSHTNHNSERRAQRWEPTCRDELGMVEAWNWREVARISGAINRRIRKMAAGHQGTRPILPAAWEATRTGVVRCGT